MPGPDLGASAGADIVFGDGTDGTLGFGFGPFAYSALYSSDDGEASGLLTVSVVLLLIKALRWTDGNMAA